MSFQADKVEIHTDEAPAAVGPYSQAIRSWETLYVSGQIALDPRTGELVSGGVEEEARQVLDNLSAVLAAAGGSMSDVVKTQVYLTDLSHYGAVNEIYAEYFEEPYPARACVEVQDLPKGVSVEIDLVASLAG